MKVQNSMEVDFEIDTCYINTGEGFRGRRSLSEDRGKGILRSIQALNRHWEGYFKGNLRFV